MFENYTIGWKNVRIRIIRIFFLRTEEGLRRLEIWVNLVINGIGRRAETLFRDQEKVAYTAVSEGFSFEDISHVVHLIMHSILNEMIRKSRQTAPFSPP